MGILFAFIGATIFLIGLYQWALGGASLWRIFSIRKKEKELSREERLDAEREVKQLEQTADRTISASLRIIAVLAVLVWAFLGVSVVLEMLGINLVSSTFARAKQYWASPTVDNHMNVQNRNETLRNMGNSFRR